MIVKKYIENDCYKKTKNVKRKLWYPLKFDKENKIQNLDIGHAWLT